eukprot:136453_1
MSESKETNNEEGKQDKMTHMSNEDVESIKKTIFYAFGEDDGKILVDKIESQPLNYVNDKRPIVAHYANVFIKSNNIDNKSLLISQLLQQMNELKTRLDKIECGDNEIPCDTHLGQIKYSKELEFIIPNDIPNTCKKILIYLTFESGHASRDIKPNITICVKANNKLYKHFFKVHTYNQNAWSFNSDNIWMPMPKDRKIIVTQTKQYSGNVGGTIAIIRYTT